MLEDCPNLLHCENRLRQEVQPVHLLGQVALTPEDLVHLGSLIRRRVSLSLRSGTRFLEREAPTCLACFLVWMGITGYRDGDYWSAVQETTGLVRSPNWQRRWGRIFVSFLRSSDLPCFSVEGSLAYVTPILAHGGIPNTCLDEFFDRVLLPLVRRELVDPTDAEEIVSELTVRREDHEGRARIEARRDELQERTERLSRQLAFVNRVIEAYDQVERLWTLEQSTAGSNALGDLPDDWEALRDRHLAVLRSIEEEIRRLEERRSHCQEALEQFTERDGQVLAHERLVEDAIAQCPALKEQQQRISALQAEGDRLVDRLSSQSTLVFAEPWGSGHGDLLTLLPLDELQAEIAQHKAISLSRAEAQQQITRLRSASVSPPRVWTIPVTVLLVIGLALMAVGTVVLLSRALPLVGIEIGFSATGVQVLWLCAPMTFGIGLVATAGFTAWHVHRQVVRQRRQYNQLQDTFDRATRRHQKVQRSIIRILDGLPIRGPQLRSPSLELHRELVSLKDTYQELCDTRRRSEELHEDCSVKAHHLEEIAASVCVHPTDSLDDTVAGMSRALDEARDRRNAAVRAEEEINDSLLPAIAKLVAEHRDTCEDLAWTEKRLVELGEGSVEAGTRYVTAQCLRQDAGMRLRLELEERYTDLESIERRISSSQRCGQCNTDLQVEARQLAEQLDVSAARVDKLQQELSYYPVAFSGTDEPVRRFLLHGGKPAEDLLVRAVSVMHQTLAEGEVSDPEDVDLPLRVVRALEHWWSQQAPSAGPIGHTALDLRFRTPTIYLDPSMCEVAVHFHTQRVLASVGSASACLEVTGCTPGLRSQTFPLRVYRGAGDHLETEDLRIPLPCPADRYEFGLEIGNAPIHQWQVAGMRSEPRYMAFEWRSGRLIDDEELPKGMVWILAHRECSLEPAGCVLEKGPLYGQWKDYVYHALNLEGADEVQIVDDQGQWFTIPVSSGMPCMLDLVGGQRLDDVHSAGINVYVGDPPRIRVPIDGEEELRLWHISVFSDEESGLRQRKRSRLSEIQDTLAVDVSKRRADVLLADPSLLGPDAAGRFTIRMRRSPYTDWFSAFCMVPELEIGFERDVYFPHEVGKALPVSAQITTNQATEFVPESPAELHETKDRTYTVHINGSESAVRGTLTIRSPDQSDLRIPLSIDIPKLRWRLQGLGNGQQFTPHDAIEEVWFGDWATASELFLIVTLPAHMGGRLELSLGGDSTRQEDMTLREGKARFDLLAFGDVLRAGPSVQTLTCTLRESQVNIEKVRLLRVRTRWEAGKIECVQTTGGRTILLDVEWTEVGRPNEKIIRLWRLAGAETQPITELRLADDARSARMTANARELPPGRYILQLESRDPWSATIARRPSVDAPNTRVIYIVSPGDLRQGEVFAITSFVDYDGRSHELGKEQYRIKVIGKIIDRKLPAGVGVDVRLSRTNEGWYVGSFEAPADTELVSELAETGPVIFEYTASGGCITGIVERYGEGPMYCCQCQTLYWNKDMDTAHQQRGHRLIGPVDDFRIKWES